MVSWMRSRCSGITFDLGAAGVRACQLQRHGGQFKLCDALHFDRTPCSSADQAEADSGGDQAPAAPRVDPAQLDRLLGQGRFRGRDVALVVSPPDVQFLPLRLPAQALGQAPERVEQALKFEIAQDSRKPGDDLEVRYWPLPGGRGPQVHVMAVVLPAGLARDWCDLLQSHGLTLRRIDVSPCALVRLARHMGAPADDDLWGVLDLGWRHSTLTVVVGAVPTYIRTLSVATHQWMEHLAAAFEVSPAVAEQILRRHAVPGSGWSADLWSAAGRPEVGAPGPSSRQAGDLPSALASVLRESLQTLAQEVGRCFSYVMQSHPDVGVKRLLLAGGGACCGAVPATLESQLGVPVTVLGHSAPDDAPAQPALANLRFGPQVAAALGGAMLDLEMS